MINKVIEVQSKSDQSWEQAAQNAVNEVASSIHNVRSIYLKDISAVVGENNQITEYRVDAKVTFEVMEEEPV